MHYGPDLDDAQRPRRLQYSLRGMLAVMTLCCVGLSLLSYLPVPLFVLPVLGVAAWSGLVVGQGVSALAAAADDRRGSWDASRRWWSRRRWAVLLASMGAVVPAITLLVFVGVFSFSGSGGVWIERCLALVHGTTELGSRGTRGQMWLVLLLLNLGSGLVNLTTFTFYARPGEDFSLLVMRVFGVLNSMTAAAAAAVLYAAV